MKTNSDVIISENTVFYINPEKDASSEPIIDEFTIKTSYVVNKIAGGSIGPIINGKSLFMEGMSPDSIRVCPKCKHAPPFPWDIPFSVEDKIFYTNPIANHYVAYHRSECSQRDLDIINNVKTPENYVADHKYDIRIRECPGIFNHLKN
jgi:hypothetical protein